MFSTHHIMLCISSHLSRPLMLPMFCQCSNYFLYINKNVWQAFTLVFITLLKWSKTKLQMFTFTSRHLYACSKRSLVWRLNRVTKSVGKRHLWPFRWAVCPVTDTVGTVRPNTARFFNVSCSVERQKLFYVGHSGSTPCFSNEGERVVFPHAASAHTAMTRQRPSLYRKYIRT